MPGPLDGFKVVDLSAVVSGPLTGALLADQGADVIKVERIGRGDIQRSVGSRRNGFSGFFHVINRGKRSIALDLATDDGRDIVRKLSEDADVVIQNFRPGVVSRLGVGYEDLSRNNSQLVYLSISGFGQTGPRSGDKAYDPIIQAYAGITEVQGRIHREHRDTPEQVNMLLLDKLTAWTANQAITAALLARTKTNKGQHVELSMLDTAISFIWSDVAADLILQGDDIDPRPPIGASGYLAEYADGWGATMTLSQAEFEGFCRAIGVDEIADDPRFSSLAERGKHRNELGEIMRTQVAAVLKKINLKDAKERMVTQDVPFTHARKLAELHLDEQVQHNGTLEEFNHPIAGLLRQAVPAPRFSDTPARPAGPAPELGQHTREILSELGLQDQIEDLYAREIVG